MVNFFNQFFIKRIYKGPSTHFVKPKVLNIRYTGNILPNYVFLNLEDVFTATPNLEKNGNGEFELSLKITKKDNTPAVIQLGLFKSEKLAKEAYVKTINAFFSPSISIFKTFLVIAVMGAALQVTTSYFINISSIISKRNAEIARKAELEIERKARAEIYKLEEKMKQGLRGSPSIPPFAAPAPTSNIPTPNNLSPEEVALKNKIEFSKVHEDLDAEINRIRAGNKDGKNESAADILLKELKGQ